MTKELITQEKRLLRESCEKIILESSNSVKVGEALTLIRVQRLYRGSHKNFDKYCREVLKMTRRNADRLIKAKPVFDHLRSNAITLGNVGQARELYDVPEDRQVEVLELAASAAGHRGVTARLIREILDRRSLDGSAESANDEIVEGVENAFEFVFEKYLEEFIVNNFDKVFEGRLRLYEDPKEDANGQQYRTAVGRIDILATEPKTKSLVVIELKKGRSSDHVVGQIARYMGWVSENLCKRGQSVKGLIICGEPDPKLSLAIKMVRNVDVKYYSVSFKLLDGP